MPKMKPHKGLQKRAKLTARGKVKTKRPFKSHLNSRLSPHRRRKLRRSMILHSSFTKQAREALGG